jgi:hypothetical protein
MRRILTVMTVALVMAAMMVAMAMPAFAQGLADTAHFCRFELTGTPPAFPPGACISFFAQQDLP